MDESNLSEQNLNENMAIKQKMEEVKTEFSNLQQEILNSLKLPHGYTVLSVSDRIDTIPLGGMLQAHDAYAVKIQNKEHEIETILVNKELQQIATVKQNNQIVLSDLTKDRFEELIGKEGKQSPRTKRKLRFRCRTFFSRRRKRNFNN